MEILPHFTQNTYIIYWSITDNTLSPKSILALALKIRYNISFKNYQEFSEFLAKNQLILAIDESHHFYSKKEQSDAEHLQSKECIRQLIELAAYPGVCIILCGSSTKLIPLAFQYNSTWLDQELQKDYHSYAELNHSKYVPVILPVLQKEELPQYLKVFLKSTIPIRNSQKFYLVFWKK